ncbi:MAG: phage major capsid protein [Proteobacteria bacterium]|nr:phage major capsid protein [Pseudomonadota bacterium]
MCEAASQGDRGQALEMAHRLDIKTEYEKALSAGSLAGGGALLTGDTATEVIELLRSVSIIRQIGARQVAIPRGTMRTPRIDVGTTAGYVAEGQAIPTTDLKTGAVMLVARKLASLAVMTNELLQFSGDGAPDADVIVLDDLLDAIGQEENRAFLFGSGSVNEPLGITNAVAASHKFDANATVNVANVVADLGTAISTLRSANIRFRQPAWIFSGRTETFLMTLLNSNGNFVFRQEIENGRLLRWPFFSTESIPNDLGGGSDESLIILTDASEIMLGDVDQVAVDRSGAATVSIDGADVNLFETDRAAIRVRTWNDLVMRHDTGLVVIESVKWGA